MVYVFYDAERFDAREYPIGRKPLEPGSFAPVTEYSISASIMPYTPGETFHQLVTTYLKFSFLRNSSSVRCIAPHRTRRELHSARDNNAFDVERLLAFVSPLRRARSSSTPHIEGGLTRRATDPANLLWVGVRL
jgi:hypothetical protein